MRKKIFLAIALVLGLTWSPISLGATLQGFQGGTGFATTTLGNLNACLTVASTSPFLTYSFGTCGGAGITIGGITSSTFQLGGNLYISSTGTIAVTSSPSFAGITFTSATGTGNLQSATFHITGAGSASSTFSVQGVLDSRGGFTFVNSTGTGNEQTNTFVATGQSTLASASSTKFETSGILKAGGQANLSGGASTTNIDATGYIKINGDKVSTSTGGSSSNASDTQVLFQNGSITGDSTFTYSSSSGQLALGRSTSAFVVGTAFSGAAQVFSYTGAIASTTVPNGATSLIINVQGGQGGGGGVPANGGSATGTLTVSQGQVLYYCVGGRGGGGAGAEGTAGFCGGGTGINNQSVGGGGMSWVGTASSFSTGTAIIVGGGGGGAGGSNTNAGAGGGTSGTNGSNGTGTGGVGGSQVAGGATGGAAGQGGNASGNAGGGGGGFYGGGAGQSGTAGGGGGSSFTTSTLTSTSTTGGVNSATGTVRFTYNVANSPNQTGYSLAVGGHIISGGSKPTMGSCGTNPTNTGNDTIGLISTAGTVTSCALNFATAWTTAPVCFVSDASTAVTPDISSVSVSTVTFGFSASLGTSTIYYFCAGY